MRASALDKVVTFAGEVLRKGHRTFSEPEATLDDKIDLRISGQSFPG